MTSCSSVCSKLKYTPQQSRLLLDAPNQSWALPDFVHMGTNVLDRNPADRPKYELIKDRSVEKVERKGLVRC